MGRFEVIEYLSFFAIHDTQTGQERARWATELTR